MPQPLLQGTSALSPEAALALCGPSTSMCQLWAQIHRLAPHIRTLTLAGSPNSGQESIARLFLEFSPYPKRPFLVLAGAEAERQLACTSNFSSLSQEVCLFLPMVDRLSAAAQAGLLRLLRMRRSRTLTVVAVDEHLRTLVSMGRLSAELANAIGSVCIGVPSLKKRVEDLPMILNQTLSLRCQGANRAVPALSEDFLRAAMQHTWPGNLREVSEVVDVLLAQAKPEGVLCAADLKRALDLSYAPLPSDAVTRMIKLDTVIQEHILAVLRECQGNKLRAAEILGVSRSTLYRMLEPAA